MSAVFSQDELAEMKSQGLIGRWIQDAVAQERAAAAQRLEEERSRAADDRLAAAQRVLEERALAEQRLVEERRAWLLRVLHRRFSTVPEPVEQRIRQADATTCDTLLDLAVGADSIEEFAQRM